MKLIVTIYLRVERWMKGESEAGERVKVEVKVKMPLGSVIVGTRAR